LVTTLLQNSNVSERKTFYRLRDKSISSHSDRSDNGSGGDASSESIGLFDLSVGEVSVDAWKESTGRARSMTETRDGPVILEGV